MKKLMLCLSMVGLVMGIGFLTQTVRANEMKQTASQQNWYVIESKHTGPECVKALDDMNASSLMGKTYWGCKSGDHRAWTILQAPNKEAALKMLPVSQQKEAKVAEVGQFTAADLQAIHSSKKS